jgi:hypothetical protein
MKCGAGCDHSLPVHLYYNADAVVVVVVDDDVKT